MGTKITKIGITNDKISARWGLLLFLRFIEKTRYIFGTLQIISESNFHLNINIKESIFINLPAFNLSEQ